MKWIEKLLVHPNNDHTEIFTVQKADGTKLFIVDSETPGITEVANVARTGTLTQTGAATITGAVGITGALTQTGAVTIVGAVTHDELQSAEHGAGAIGTAFAPRTYRRTENGIIITTIKIDLTGLACKGDAAKDAIGLAAGGAAYIGRYVVANYGVVFRIEMSCIEVPGQGTATITTDIDLGAEDADDTAYDGAVDDVVINTAALVAGETAITNVPALTANDYLYLVEGNTDASTGVYNAGQYIIRFYGHALIT